MAISPHFEATLGFRQVQLHAIHWLYEHRGDTTVTASAGADVGTSASSSASAIASTNNSAGTSTTAPRLDHREKTVSSFVQEDEHANSSNLGQRALNLAETTFDNASVVGYIHRNALASRQVLSQSDGSLEAKTDCSGFMSYIVHSIAPRHYRAVRSMEPQKSYPQAKIWAQFFDTLDSNQPRDGWLAISNWRDLRPGDIIAWEEGKISAGGNTGHVMMVQGKPGEIKQQQDIRYFEVLVIDSSSVYHFPPEHLPPKASQTHRNGLGEGNVRILLSEQNVPVGYWAGTYWGEGEKPIKGPTLTKLVRFARMTSLEKADH
jgi:cell wall-associated NlpC family hydrolase